MENTEKTPQGQPKIDFAPIMRECQTYAKLMSDVVKSGVIDEDQYMDLEGHRVAIADTFCFLLFGEQFDNIRKQYIDLVTKTLDEKSNGG